MFGTRTKPFITERLEALQEEEKLQLASVEALRKKVLEAEKIQQQDLLKSAEAKLEQIQQRRNAIKKEMDEHPDQVKLEQRINQEKNLKDLLTQIQKETENLQKYSSTKENLQYYLQQTNSNFDAKAFKKQLDWEINTSSVGHCCCGCVSCLCCAVVGIAEIMAFFSGNQMAYSALSKSGANGDSGYERELATLEKIDRLITQYIRIENQLTELNRSDKEIKADEQKNQELNTAPRPGRA